MATIKLFQIGQGATQHPVHVIENVDDVKVYTNGHGFKEISFKDNGNKHSLQVVGLGFFIDSRPSPVKNSLT